MAEKAPPSADTKNQRHWQVWALSGKQMYKGSRQPRWAMASQLVVSGANFGTTIIVLRSIGFEAFGQFSLCFLLIMVTRNYLCGVVLDPMSAIAPKLRAVSAPSYRSFLGLSVVGFAALSTAIIVVLTLPLAYLLSAPWLPALAVALALANFVSCFADYASRYHFVYNQPIKAFAVDCMRYGLQVLCILALTLSDAAWLSPTTILYSLACGSVLGAFVGLVTQGPFSWSSRLARVVWPRHLNFIRWMSLSISVETVQALAPMFIGIAFLGEAALGAVRAIQQMTNILNLPTNALLQILPARGAAIYKSHGAARLRSHLKVTVRWVTFYFAVTAAVLVVLGPMIAQVLYNAVPPSFYAILFLYVAANFFISVRVIVGVMFLSMERPRLVLRIHLVGAAIALTVPFSAVVLGAEAIPLSTALATFGTMIGSILLTRRMTRDE